MHCLKHAVIRSYRFDELLKQVHLDIFLVTRQVSPLKSATFYTT